MLLQLSFDDGAAIVDPLALPDLHALATSLTQTTVVGHALSSDLKIFADRYDLVPPRIFDTQIAASFLGYGMQVSLADLVREFATCVWPSRKRSAIGRRGRFPRQIEYLVGDVAHLLELYDVLRDRLEGKGVTAGCTRSAKNSQTSSAFVWTSVAHICAFRARCA